MEARTPLTEDEHRARAMLLGRIYIDWARVYVFKDDWDLPIVTAGDHQWIDAVTLAEIPQEEKLGRILGGIHKPAEQEDFHHG